MSSTDDRGRGDGYGRLISELQEAKLEGFEVLAVPKTPELRDQQEQSLSDPLEWVLQALRTGRFGPYVQHEKQYASLESPEDVFTIGLNHAVS